jgi:hypothetical protein
VAKDYKKGFNSLAMLVACEIWKHRNDCIFNGSIPSITTMMGAVTSVFFGTQLGQKAF